MMMMSRITFTVTIVWLASAYATPSLAGVGFEIFGGARQGKMEVAEGDRLKKYDVTGSDFGLSLSYSPPLIPLQFGVIGSYYTLDSSAAYKGKTQVMAGAPTFAKANPKGSITGMQYGLMLRAWLPFGVIQPYIEGAYVLGQQQEKVADKEDDLGSSLTWRGNFQTKGPVGGLGLRIAPTPFFAITLGGQLSLEQRVLTRAHYEQKSATTTEKGTLPLSASDKKARAFTTAVARLGFAFSF